MPMHPPLAARKPTPLLPDSAQAAQRTSPSWGVNLGDLQRLCLEINGLPAHEMDAGLSHLLRRLGTLLNVQRVECALLFQETSGSLVTQHRQVWAATDRHLVHDCIQTLAHAVPLRGRASFVFSLKRDAATPEFDEQTRDWLMCALAGLGRWLQWFALSHGEPSSLGPMPAQQRNVLMCLLSGLTEKQIASQLRLNMHTTHQYVKAIYRRFGVHSRPSLTARWLLA